MYIQHCIYVSLSLCKNIQILIVLCYLDQHCSSGGNTEIQKRVYDFIKATNMIKIIIRTQSPFPLSHNVSQTLVRVVNPLVRSHSFILYIYQSYCPEHQFCILYFHTFISNFQEQTWFSMTFTNEMPAIKVYKALLNR